MSDKIQQRPPASAKEIKVESPLRKGVGLTAVKSSVDHMRRWMDAPDALKASLKMNQKDGFDCPGCAWPDPDDERSKIGEYCENGIKALAEERTKYKADSAFWNKFSVAELSSWSDYKLGKAGRITHPMYLPAGADRYQKISWKEAFQKIGDQLKSYDDPNQAIFYTSGRTSNEAAFLYGLFVRMYGTNNLPDCSNMCHESSGKGLSETVGIGKGSVTLEDLHEAEVIMIMGQNPGTNHPRMLTALENCKSNGGKIIAVNPLKETGLIHYTNPQKPLRILSGGVNLADIYLQVRVNGDVALLKAIMIKLIERHETGENVLDEAFINDFTVGYTELKKSMQHYAGAGTCPVRGHSNVQGDRTMGIWEKMSDDFHDRLGKAFGFESPKEHGCDTVDAIKMMAEGRAKFFFGMGGNFLSATPDTDMTAEALQKCDMTVHVSTKPNRSHLIHGKEALILPCLGRTEIDMQSSGYQFVSVENSMGVVHNSKGALPPSSEQLISEPDIVRRLAKAALTDAKKGTADWDAMVGNYDLIRDKIEEVIPGFDNYNDRVRIGKGFYLPNPARDRRFRAGDAKAHFSVVDLPIKNLKDNEFHLMTIRSHDQYNTTIYGLEDRYRGISGDRRIVMMSKSDMQRLQLKTDDRVDITSYFEGSERSVSAFRVVPYDIPNQCLGAYFPEANPLVHINNFARGSRTPVSKLIRVTVRKV